MGVMLEARNLNKGFGGIQAVDNASFDIEEGTITSLIGPNGAGKTTLVRILLGLMKTDIGSVYRKPGLKIGYVPQKLHLDAVLPLRVRDFLLLAGRYAETELVAALNELQLPHMLDAAVQTLSGGELQRVVIARALLKQPDVLVLDEPAQGVDIIGQQSLYQTIKSIRDKYNCGVLMVSHDLHLVMASTDRVICLNTHVCCTGHPDAVSEHPEYLKIFGAAMDGFAHYSHHHDHSHDVHGAVVPLDDHDEGCQHD